MCSLAKTKKKKRVWVCSFFSNKTERVKMGYLFILFTLCSLATTSSFGQEAMQVLNLYETSPQTFKAMKAVSVGGEDINEVSNSVLKAESWLRSHVLSRFPASKITTIVVGGDAQTLCQDGKVRNSGSCLTAMWNIYYSLTRWGLEKKIKVSFAVSINCFEPYSVFFGDALARFLESTNSTYTIVLHSKFSPLTEETLSVIASRTKIVKKFASFDMNKINVMFYDPKQETREIRKLASIESSEVVKPYPARPIPLPEASQAPLHSSVEFSVPSHIVKNPLSPLASNSAPPPLSIPADSPFPYTFPISSPPTMPFPAAPGHAPYVLGPVYGSPLPPCKPHHAHARAPAPATETGVIEKLWCVSKPSVPSDMLQEALDYACGAGGADCEEIMPRGSCFYPDSVVAHASYAYNSYWQKTKRDGGNCSFGGTAMLVNSDPSYLQCRFVLS